MIIKPTTKIFGSFTDNPGVNGSTFFNSAFRKNDIDAIYIPIKCDNVVNAINIMELMNFSGASFSKPHKVSILDFLDDVDDNVEEIGSVNTVVVCNGIFKGFNTDWLGAYQVLKPYNLSKIYIYGKGGFSKAVQFACNKLNISFELLNRNDTLPVNEYIFNATPADLFGDNILDGRPFTDLGFKIFQEQAKIQYELYTGMKYE
jgi:shikimate 5-dehydrogenase